jgi:hypothetical protein
VVQYVEEEQEGEVMAELTQCESCGAVLAKEDIFCGECGAPNPSLEGALDAANIERPVAPPPDVSPSSEPVPPAPARPDSSRARWRAASIALVVLGTIACVAGLAAFLVFGLMEGENTTPAEDWLFSALCCLLPIGGTGAILAISGVGVWFARLRNR